jgi:hypothetical protein
MFLILSPKSSSTKYGAGSIEADPSKCLKRNFVAAQIDVHSDRTKCTRMPARTMLRWLSENGVHRQCDASLHMLPSAEGHSLPHRNAALCSTAIFAADW